MLDACLFVDMSSVLEDKTLVKVRWPLSIFWQSGMTALTHEYFETLAGKIITSFKTNVALGRIFPLPLLTMFSLEERERGWGGGGGKGKSKKRCLCEIVKRYYS